MREDCVKKRKAILQVTILVVSALATFMAFSPGVAAANDTLLLQDANFQDIYVINNGTTILINVTDSGTTSGPGTPTSTANVYQTDNAGNSISVVLYDNGGLFWDIADDGYYLGMFNVTDSGIGETTNDALDYIAVPDAKSITVEANLDGDANQGSDTVTSDFTAPVADITSDDNSFISGNYYLSITATDANLRNVTYQIDTGDDFPTQPEDGGVYTAIINTSSMSQDVHEIKVTARDNATNEGYDWVNLTVDRTVPYVSINPSPMYVADTYKLNVTVQEINLDEPTVTYRLDTDPWTALPKVAFETFSVDVDVTGKDEDVHSIFISATDMAENANTTETVTFTIDRTGPSITMNTLDGIVVSDAFLLNATVTDDNMVNNDVKYRLDGGTAVILASKGNNNFETTINTVPLDEGTHIATVTVKDLAGNTNTSSDLNFIVDRTVPEITITSATSGYFTDILTVTATVTDANLDTKKVAYTIDGGSPLQIKEPVSGDSYSIDIDVSIWVEKRYDLCVRATDMADNSDEACGISVVVDRTGPSFTYSFEPNAAGYRLEVIVNDPNLDPDSVYYKIDGGTQTEFDNIVMTSYSAIILALDFPEGNHTITIGASDYGGNQKTSDYTEVVSDPPPKVTGLVATDEFDGTITLTWDPSPASDLDHYNVYYRAFDIFTDVAGVSLTGDTKNTEFQMTGLVVGTTYYFAVTAVDALGNFNTAVFPISVTPKESVKIPILVITSLSLDNTNPREGDTVTVTVEIDNTGTIDASNLKVRLYVDGTSDTVITINSLPAGESVTRDLDWSPLEGDHELKVEVLSGVSPLATKTHDQTITVKPQKIHTQQTSFLDQWMWPILIITVVVIVVALAVIGLRGSKKEEDELRKQEIELGLRPDEHGRIHKPGDDETPPEEKPGAPPSRGSGPGGHDPDLPSSPLLGGEQPPPQQPAPQQPPPQQPPPQAPPPQAAPPPPQKPPPQQPPPQQQQWQQ